MNNVHILWALPVTALALGACARHTPVARAASPASPVATGVLPASSSMTIDVGVSDVRLMVEDRDSVRWSVETKPAGCATVAAAPSRLGFARRSRDCAARWDIHIPAIDDVHVIASVGDIDVTTPADRAVRLRSGVGNVRLRLDGRELRHAGAPGSGDHLELGDPSTLPRLDVRTDVGSVRAELRTVTRSRDAR
jgi:hypothetical protein